MDWNLSSCQSPAESVCVVEDERINPILRVMVLNCNAAISSLFRMEYVRLVSSPVSLQLHLIIRLLGA